MDKTPQKGIALIFVLAALMIVIILANVILNIMSSHARLTHHEVSRIQAYYASFAGMNLAYDGLRRGDWARPAVGASYDRYLCRDTTSNTNCNLGAPTSTIDATIPAVIEIVSIRVAERTAPGCNAPAGSQFCISATATYTFTSNP